MYGECMTVDVSPVNYSDSDSKEKHVIVSQLGKTYAVRLLRPKESDKPDVQKSAECQPDTR